MEDTFNQEKFAELIIYFSYHSKEDPKFGAVKLNKLLYYADFNAYRLLGHSITGADYQKLNEGPAPRQMLPVRRMMIDSQDIAIEFRPYFNSVQQRIIPSRKPRKVFLDEELAIINETMAALWDMSGRQVSDLSHSEIGWQVTEVGETIPYETTWLSSDPIPQEAEDHWRKGKVTAASGG